MLFAPDPKDKGNYSSLDKSWRLSVKSSKIILIFNEQGWVYVYQDGSLISVESPTGRALNFIYNKGDLLRVELTDADEMVKPLILIACGYDEQHRCVQMEIGPLLHLFAYEKKPGGRLIGWDQPNGQSLNFYYDDHSGVLKEVERARADKDKKLVPYGEPLTLKTKYFEPRQKQAEGADPKRNPANYFIEDDGAYQYSYSVNPNGWQAQGKNAPQYEVTATDQNGIKQSLKVGLKDNQFSMTDGYGKETKAVYFGGGLPYAGKIRALYQNGERVMQYRYDKKTGWLTHTTDKDGVSTFYSYQKDGFYTPLFQGKYGRTIKTVAYDPKPVKILRGYDLRDAEVLAEMEYDARGRLIAKADGEGNVTEFTYNDYGELTGITPPDAAPLTLKYDDYGRVTELTQGSKDAEAKPQTMKLEYNEHGKISKQTAPDGSVTAFTYNNLGQTSEVLKNSQLLAAYEYDLDGKVVAEKDGKNRAKKLERDQKGNIVAEILPGGIVTKYEYDDHGRRTAQIDANGNKITFKYDAYGHLIEQKNPLGQTLTWTYGKDGKLTGRTNGAQNVRYEYDERGRLWLVDYGAAGQMVRYTYNDKGQVTREETPTFVVEKRYDHQNRVTALKMIDLRQALDGKDRRLREQVIRYHYNSRGQKTRTTLSEVIVSDQATAAALKYDLLQQTDYQYDSQGKLTAIRSNGQTVFTQKYDGQNRLATRIYGNGIRGDYGYDAQGRLAKIAFNGGPLKKALALEYAWDVGNELISRSWNGATQWFGYDAAGRLTGVFSDKNKTKPLETYRYDPAGNITGKFVYGEKAELQYNAANQLVSMLGGRRTVNYTYDAAGRLTVSADNLIGQTVSRYGWLDKPVTMERRGLGNVSTGGALALDYYPDGHLAVKGPVDAALLADAAKPWSASVVKEDGAFAKLLKRVGLRTEDEALPVSVCQARMQVVEVFVWDGLGLLRRNQEVYAIEPHISGGAVVYVSRIGDLKSGRYLLNDMLGTTLAEVDGDRVRFNDLSSFGLPVKKTPEILKPDAAVPKVTVSGL